MSRAYGNQRFDAVDIRCQQSREMAEPLISENQSRCREIESRRWLTQRALDAGDSAAFSSIFLASRFSCSQADSALAQPPRPVVWAVRRAQCRFLNYQDLRKLRSYPAERACGWDSPRQSSLGYTLTVRNSPIDPGNPCQAQPLNPPDWHTGHSHSADHPRLALARYRRSAARGGRSSPRTSARGRTAPPAC
jgi:hypothetical protein